MFSALRDTSQHEPMFEVKIVTVINVKSRKVT